MKLYFLICLLPFAALAQRVEDNRIVLIDGTGYFYEPTNAVRRLNAADARIITEGTTNILAIGIDARDFDVIRFYLRGSNVMEFRQDEVLHRARSALPPVVRGGSAQVTILETTKQIAFNRPMQDASYIVLATPSAATTVSISGKTTNGFTLNLALGIAGRVDWLAINP